MANRQRTELTRNRPEAKNKSYFVYKVNTTCFYDYDEDLATGDLETDKILFRNRSYISYPAFNRSYGMKRKARGVMQLVKARLGHAVDYPEHTFKRNGLCRLYLSACESDSYAYKLAKSWKGNSKRKHQWID